MTRGAVTGGTGGYDPPPPTLKSRGTSYVLVPPPPPLPYNLLLVGCSLLLTKSFQRP